MSLKYEPSSEPLHISRFACAHRFSDGNYFRATPDILIRKHAKTEQLEQLPCVIAEDAPGTPTQSHISPSILVYKVNNVLVVTGSPCERREPRPCVLICDLAR